MTSKEQQMPQEEAGCCAANTLPQPVQSPACGKRWLLKTTLKFRRPALEPLLGLSVLDYFRYMAECVEEDQQ